MSNKKYLKAVVCYLLYSVVPCITNNSLFSDQLIVLTGYQVTLVVNVGTYN